MQNIKDLLRKIKLIENFSTEVPLKINDLVTKLDTIIDEDQFDMFEAFTSSKNEFKGKVDENGFTIKRKAKLGSNNKGVTIAYGLFTEQNDSTKIEVEINGFDTFMKIFYSLLLFFLVIIVLCLVFVSNDNSTHNSRYTPLVMILLVSVLFINPYVTMRRNVKRLKYDLERELFYITKV